MPQPVEIFENEEASKLLDYFVAYKKLMSKVEYIKCISVLNNEVHFSQNQTPTQTPDLTAAEATNQPPIGYPSAFDR
ncbi:MAG: hypothetical protein ACM3UL_00510 [Ignavibacteria bacterium]